MATLSFKNVNKVYDNKFHAVHDFNLEVKDKEFIVFVGPSGCGKSTTLRMVAGFEDITSGEIWIDKTCVNKLAPKDRNIAMVFQNYALYPHMTVFDNMAFALKLRKVYLPVTNLDTNDPKYIEECNKAIEKSEKYTKDTVAQMKKDKKPKEEISDFKFRQKNNLITTLENIGNKYEKPALTFDPKKVEAIEKELAKVREELANEKTSISALTSSLEESKNELAAKKRERSGVNGKLNDVLYDADEYYTNKSLNAKIKKLNEELNEAKTKAEKAKISAKIERLKAKKSEIAGDVKEQSKPVNENETKKKALNKDVSTLEKEIKNKQRILDEVMDMRTKALNGVAIISNEDHVTPKFIELVKKINELEAKREKEYNTCKTQLYAYRHYTSKEIASKVFETSKILGLEPYLKRKPAALSGGQRQRVALGRAIVRSPKVFLMDEPLSNLDAKLRVQTRSEISKIHQKVGATTIYVTHDQTEAMTMASRIVIMCDGVVQQIGTPKQVYEKPENLFVAGFIGSPSMNFIKGYYERGYFVTSNGKGKIELSKAQSEMIKKAKVKEITLGIRPEHMYLANDKSVSKKSKPFEVNVEITELLGSEIIVYGNMFGQKVLAKISSKNAIKPNDTIKCVFDEDCAHFFDAKTGKAIR